MFLDLYVCVGYCSRKSYDVSTSLEYEGRMSLKGSTTQAHSEVPVEVVSNSLNCGPWACVVNVTTDSLKDSFQMFI